MSREFPDWVNPWKAAEGNRIYRGTIALAKMKRLEPMLAAQNGEASFEARFSRDRLGFAVILLNVEASLPLICQVSLEPYEQPVERSTSLVVLSEADDQEQLPGHYEAVQAESDRLEFMELVQDELILSVPQVPRKPGLEELRYSTDPEEDYSRLSGEQNKPFAALAGLLQKEQSNEDQD